MYLLSARHRRYLARRARDVRGTGTARCLPAKLRVVTIVVTLVVAFARGAGVARAGSPQHAAARMLPEFQLYSEVTEANNAARERTTNDGPHGPRLVIAAFIDRWSPPAKATADALQVAQAEVSGFARIIFVDATAERDSAWEAGVVTTPSLIFYWDGELVPVSRPDRDEDNKYVGAAHADKIVEIIRHARDCRLNGDRTISLDF